MSKAGRSQSFKSATIQGPLTPSAGPPSVALQLSSASEHKMNRHPTTGATAMLARVASSPTTPKVSTPAISGPPSPDLGSGCQSRQGSCSSVEDESEKALSCFREAIMQRERGDQYFSFPDFDRFRRSSDGDGSVK